MSMNLHRINRFSRLTGLSTHVIRAWERRFQLVNPVRGPNRYRLYSDEDVTLFRYLKGETDKGSSIGELAELGREELLRRCKLAEQESSKTNPPIESLLDELITSLQDHDRASFERRLNGAVAVIPFEESLHRILLPLQIRVGEMWHEGKLSVAVEHYVTRQVQQKLFAAMNQLRTMDHGPQVVVACPPKEFHEVGAQTVAYFCAVRGCRVSYLGADVPVSALIDFSKKIRPQLVLMSFTVPWGNANGMEILEELKNGLEKVCPLIVGGAGIPPMHEKFQRFEIDYVEDYQNLEPLLLKLSGSRVIPTR